MKKLTIASVGTFDQYQQQRASIRQAIIEHKKNRRVPLGPNATLHFEDYMTMKYQVQEMIRAEHLRDAGAISEELDAYNPLIPDGSNLKCTFMIEFPDEAERRQQLKLLINLEQHVFIQIDGFEPVPPVADEDLERSTEDKTSAVHFMRYEFSQEMIQAAKKGATWAIYSDHPAYQHRIEPLPDNIASSLCRDFD
ncbi:MAG: DUF3501 family protein [Pseudohongiella sp.]|nr:DUF3501 family protein [Pseudohongiella sp.]MDO9519112.1 DUF3501 family protein [Pseudohongiella sp.]